MKKNNIINKEKQNKELDKFYTKESVVKKLIKKIDFNKYDLVIEPSAGSGAFLFEIKHDNTIGLDIHPEAKGIKQQNWFKYKISKKYKNVLIIGNPPFGINNDLSSRFLKHAFSFKNVFAVAFILPNVYKKYTNQKLIPNNFYINKIINIENEAFKFNGNSYHVPCSFFIITKDDTKDLRQDINIKSNDFIFSNSKNYDFFIFGAAPKKIIESPNKNNRGYYIKSMISKKKLINRFKNIDWKGHSSANGGVYWLTKIDIIENYNRKWEKNEK